MTQAPYQFDTATTINLKATNRLGVGLPTAILILVAKPNGNKKTHGKNGSRLEVVGALDREVKFNIAELTPLRGEVHL